MRVHQFWLTTFLLVTYNWSAVAIVLDVDDTSKYLFFCASMVTLPLHLLMPGFSQTQSVMLLQASHMEYNPSTMATGPVA